LRQFLSGILSILDRKERVKLFVLIFLDVVINALDVAFLGLFVLVVNFYVKGAGLPFLSFLPQSLTNQNSVLLIGVFSILFGIKNLLAYWVSASQYRFIYGVATRLSDRNIRHYLNTDYLEFVNIDSSVHIHKISQQPIEFSHYILTNFQQIVSQAVLVLFTVTAILFYHATLFVLLFLLLLPAVVLLAWILKKKLKHIRKNIKKTSEDTLKNLNEALAGYVESNIYGREDFFTSRYHRQQAQLNHHICVQQTLQALPSRLIEFFAIMGFFILIVLNKWSSHQASVDMLTIGIFIAAAYKIIPGVVKILNGAGQMKTYEFTLHDLSAIANNVNTGPVQSVDPIHAIKVENIHFRYNDKALLEGVSFEIMPGDFIGMTANSGRGKTTLMNILLGFIAPQGGMICINGKISRTDERRDYLSRISYIKQQPFFIYDTLLKNIILQEDGYDENRLKEILGFCGLNILTDQHQGNNQMIITENGKNLSGGQRQRVMLARALYHGFDLLILDEPFGELDQLSENAILEKLQTLATEGKMILFITHNKQSLSYCNKIVSLDE
jgi:ABC-type multidrug transport system fused ATPase/permease subunit